jgi:hypothetical protein
MDMQLSITTEPIKPVKPPRYKRPKKIGEEGNFINNSVLFPEVLRCKEKGKVSVELAKMIQLMTRRYVTAKNFAHLPYKEDLEQSATLALFLNILKFNPERSGNVFAYSTTIMYHSALQYIAAENRQRNIRDQLLVNEGVNGSLGFMEKEHDRYREKHSELYEGE